MEPPAAAGEMSGERCPRGTVLVPGGSFMMGTDAELVAHLMKICARYMGSCQREWFAVESPRKSVYVSDFCVETYEFPDEAGRKPAGGLSWSEAAKSCQSKGRRLCEEKEWEKACAGVGDGIWSYGRKYRLNACNIATEGLGQSGSFHRCVSEYGAVDMNGNLAEWTADSVEIKEWGGAAGETYVLKGGSWNDLPFFTRCSSREFQRGKLNYSTFGARCCVAPAR